jgi:transposase
VLGARAKRSGVCLALSTLFPHLVGLRLDQVTLDGETVRLHLTARARSARCPLCARRSTRVQSSYHRTIADLPICGRRLLLSLRVRRFRCVARRCPRAIFAERFPGLVAAHARRTEAQRQALEAIGFALGGAPGARLATRLASPVSRATLLRLIRAAPVGSPEPPQVLGVDDWSQRRGRTYGTILIDLEQHRRVDLLPDRTADTLAAWLQQHPGVQIISRDRSGAYAEGASRGAPQAKQVADRFHLIKNLGEAVEQVLTRHRSSLAQLTLPVDPAHARDAAPHLPPGVPGQRSPLTPRPTWLQRGQQRRRGQRLAHYEQVVALRERGLTIPAIAQHLKLGERTVQRWLSARAFPERKPRRRPMSPLAPYADYLDRRWAEGCHNGMQLWREVCDQGYLGPRYRIWEVAQRLRQGLQAVDATGDASSTRQPKRAKPPTPRRVAGLFLRRAVDRTVVEQVALTQLLAGCPEVQLAYDLTERFTALIRERQAVALDDWLAAASTSELPELARFATGLARDKAAVVAAASLPYSNGQTEGQITRLKLVKRAMYGRAKFDLLRQRVLRVA